MAFKGAQRYGLVLAICGSLLFILGCDDQQADQPDPNGCTQPLQGRLAVKGICMNYVIEVLDPIDAEWVEAEWTHPDTEVVYSNAFRLGSVCDFDDRLNEGDLFTFEASPEPFESEERCAVCLAYSPTPTKTLYLRLCD